MRIFDYLFSQFYGYYREHSEKIKWSTPQSYSVYLLAIGVLVWLVLMEFLIALFVLHSAKFQYIYILPLVIFFLLNGRFEKRYSGSQWYEDLYKRYAQASENKKTTGRLITLCYLRVPLILITVLIFVY